MERRSFIRWLAIVAAIGLVVRLVVVAFASRDLSLGDGFWYHAQAQIIANGHGYLNPGQYLFTGQHLATAEHPPLFPFLLAIVSWFGGTSVLAHQLTGAVLGVAGVIAVGFLGRAVRGARVGLIAALIAAISPTMWRYDAQVLSEGLLVLTAALFLLVVYRFWDQPRPIHGVLLGATLALATYTRAEMVFLGLVIVVPVAVWNPRLVGAAARARVIATAAVIAMLFLAPWVVRNLTTFERPVVFSNNQDSVIAGANCAPMYYGSGIGSWVLECNGSHLTRHGDQSVVFEVVRRRGLTYMRDHLSRLPVVMVARVGREWEVFRPFQEIARDGRTDRLWTVSTLTFWVLAIAGGLGAVQLRRARRLVWPLAVMAPFVTVLAAGTYGLVRLRMPLDIALVVLAAVPVEWLLARRYPARDMAASPTGE
jgi:hypothetical protein